MCRAEYVIYACGHAKNYSADCELAAHHGALFNRVGCVKYTFSSKHVEGYCGQSGFYCSQTQDGRLIDKTYEHLQPLKSRLQDIRNQVGTNYVRLQSYINQAAACNISMEALETSQPYQALQQEQMAVLQSNKEVEVKCKYLEHLISHAYNNRGQLQAAAGLQPAWDGRKYDIGHSIFSEALLEPIRRQVPRQTPNPASLPSTIAQDALGSGQVVPQVQMAMPNAAHGSGGQRLPQRPLKPVHQRQGSIASAIPSTETSIPREKSPPNETKYEKAFRLRNHYIAVQNKEIEEAMARQGYDVENYGVRPPPKNGREYCPTKRNRNTIDPSIDRRPHNPGTPPRPPKLRKSDRSAATANAGKSTSGVVRRSTRTRNYKPNYVDDLDDSDVETASKEFSPSKSDAAYDESPTKSEDSASPVKSTRGTRGQRKRAPSVSAPASRVHSTLSNIIADYQRGAKQVGDTGSGTNDTQTASPLSSSENFQFPSEMAVQRPSEAFGFETSSQHDARAQNHTGWQSIAPIAPMTRPFNDTGLQNAQAERSDEQGGRLGSARASSDAYKGAAYPQLGSLSMQQGSGRSFPTSFGVNNSASTMLRSLHGPQTSHGNAAMPYASHQNDSGRSSHAMSDLHAQPTDNRAMNSRNIFDQNDRPAMTGDASGAAFGADPADRPVYARFLPVPAAAPRKDDPLVTMPTLTSNFRKSPVKQPDYTGSSRGFSSTARFMPNFQEHSHQDAETEPVKPDVASSRSLNKSSKRPRLSLPGEDGAPSFDPQLPSLQSQGLLGLPSNAPSLGLGDVVNEYTNLQTMPQQDKPAPTYLPLKTDDVPSVHESVQPDAKFIPSHDQKDYFWNKLPELAQGGYGNQPAGFAAEDELHNDADQTSEPDWDVMLNDTQCS